MKFNLSLSSTMALSLLLHSLGIGAAVYRWPAPVAEPYIQQPGVRVIALVPPIENIAEENHVVEQTGREAAEFSESTLFPSLPAESALIPVYGHDGSPAEIIGDEQARTACLRYQDSVKRRIERARRYPLWARRSSEQAACEITFILQRDGSCRQITVVSASGPDRLRKDAVDTVRRAAPFPGFPDSVSGDSMPMRVRIRYDLDAG